MNNATELERLVVKLVGDTAQYTASFDKAVQDTKVGAKALEGASDAVTGALKQNTAAQRAHDAVLQSSKTLMQSLRTPTEKYSDTLADLISLQFHGVTSTETFNRAVAANEQELRDATGETARHNRELARAAQITAQAMSPLKRLNAEIKERDSLLKKGRISTDVHAASIAKLTQEYTQGTAAYRNHQELMRSGVAITNNLRSAQDRLAGEINHVNQVLTAGGISANTASKEIARLKNEAVKGTAAWQRHADALQRGKNLTQSLLTPIERYEQELKEINDLHRHGAITAQTYARALERIKGSLNQTAGQGSTFNQTFRQSSLILQNLGMNMRQAGRFMITYISAPLAALGGFAVKSFADFDNAMTQSTAIMDVTESQIQRMTDRALQLGAQGIRGPRELAESYYFLASAGLTAEQSIEALSTVTDFSTAGMFDMSKATDLLTDAQSALGLTVKDPVKNMRNMTRVSDGLVGAARLANATVEQFSVSLTSKAGPSMKFYNRTLEEGLAVLAAYADQGVKAELSGTAYDRALRLLTKTAAKNADAHKKLGFEVFSSTGEFRNMADIAENLEGILKGMSDQQKSVTLAMLGFEPRIQQVIAPLIGLSGRIREYEERLLSMSDTTKNVAEKNLSSFTNQFWILWNQIKVAAIDIGKTLSPVLLSINDMMRKAIKWWMSLSQSTKIAALSMAGLAIAAGPVILSMGIVVSVIGAVGLAITGMVAAGAAAVILAAKLVAGFVVVTSGLGLLSAAAAGVVTWLVGPEGMVNAWNSALDGMKNFAGQSVGFLANFRANMGRLVAWMKSNWLEAFFDIGQAALNMYANMSSNQAVAIKTIIRLVAALGGSLGGMFRRMFTVDFVKSVWDGMKKAGEVFSNFAEGAAATIASIWTGESVDFGGFLGTLGDDLVGGSEDFGETMRGILADGFAEMKGPLDGFKGQASDLPDFLTDMGEKSSMGLVDALVSPLIGMNLLPENIIPKTQEQLTLMWNRLREANEAAGVDMSEEMQRAFNAMTETDELQSSVDELAASLEDQAHTFGMTSEAAQVYRLQMKGAGEDMLRDVRKWQQIIAKQEKDAKVKKDGMALTKSLRTDQEKYNDKLEEYKDLLQDGAISEETFQRAKVAAEEALEKALDKKQKVTVDFQATGLDALVSGSADALEAYMKHQLVINGLAQQAAEAEADAARNQLPLQNGPQQPGIVRNGPGVVSPVSNDLNVEATPNAPSIQADMRAKNKMIGLLGKIASNTENTGPIIEIAGANLDGA